MTDETRGFLASAVYEVGRTMNDCTLKSLEDKVSLWLNGGSCGGTQCPHSDSKEHTGASRLLKLTMWKALVLEFPHLSRNPTELDGLIRTELKKTKHA